MSHNNFNDECSNRRGAVVAASSAANRYPLESIYFQKGSSLGEGLARVARDLPTGLVTSIY